MGNITYDQDGKIDATTEQMEAAFAIGARVPIKVSCEDAQGQRLTFFAFVWSVPRLNEHLVLQDGNAGYVSAIMNDVTTFDIRGVKFISMIIHVLVKIVVTKEDRETKGA